MDNYTQLHAECEQQRSQNQQLKLQCEDYRNQISQLNQKILRLNGSLNEKEEKAKQAEY